MSKLSSRSLAYAAVAYFVASAVAAVARFRCYAVTAPVAAIAFWWRCWGGRRRMRCPSIPAPSPFWLAAVRSYPKDHVQHAGDEERQAAAVHEADVAAALREASSALRRRRV